jgi:hypothetical protein
VPDQPCPVAEHGLDVEGLIGGVLHGEAVADRHREGGQETQPFAQLVVGLGLEGVDVELAIPVEELGHARPQARVADEVGEEVEEEPVLPQVGDDAQVLLDQDLDAVVVGPGLRELAQQAHVLVVHDGVGERPDETGLVAEVVADRGLVLTGLGGDRLEREALEACPAEHATRGGEDAPRRRRQLGRRVLGHQAGPSDAGPVVGHRSLSPSVVAPGRSRTRLRPPRSVTVQPAPSPRC